MDFLVKELDILFHFNELETYLDDLEKSYQYLKWTSDLKESVNDHNKHNIDGIYGWGIQSNLPDLEMPCPPYNIHKKGSDDYKDTKLVFNFAKKIRKIFPFSRQLSISAHPPGTKINLHVDTESYLKIHIPIKSNNKSYFFFEKEKFVLTPGKIYLVNTSKMHGTVNEGDTFRIHLFFKVPVDKIGKVLELREL